MAKITDISAMDTPLKRMAEKTASMKEFEWQSVFDSVKDAIFVLDSEYKILHCNKAASDTFNKTGDILGKHCWEVVHGTKEPILQCPIGRMSKSRKRERSVIRDGERWMEVTADPVLDDKGEICGAVHIVSDITARITAEDALKQSLSMLSATVESTADGILVIDTAGRISYFNSRFARMWGMPEKVMTSGEDEKAIAHVLGQIKYPEKFLEKVKYLYSHPEMDSFDQIEFNDGRIFERYSHPQVIDGCPVGRVWSFRDVSERKHAEEVLRESEERFHKVIEHAPISMAVVAMDGTIEYVNRKAVETFGYPHEDIPNMDRWWMQAYPDEKYRMEVIAAWSGRVEKAIAGKHDIIGGEYRITCKDGTVKTVFIYGAPILNKVFVLFEDITERKKIEERLRHSEKMEAIGQLAGGIAHDFNNQLMGIMGYAEMLYDRLDEPSMREDAACILRASNRASDLTRDLLAFSRKGKYLEAPMNVHNIIEEVVGILGHSIDRRIEIKRVLKASPPMIVGDPTQIQNALLNLALNARDAMLDGGEMTFTTENLEMEDVFSEGERLHAVKGRYLKICVMDSGTGMDDETMKHLFEPFFTTKEVGKGTGMGLASVYGTVENHSGVINVKSKPGEGTEFSLCFPLFEGNAASEDADAVHAPASREARILLVDDEEIVRHLVSGMIRSFGHKVITCKDGMEAVETYRQSWGEIDLVILDMMMPRMSGRDAFFWMRGINKDLKVLLTSGFSIDGEARSLLDAGVKGFIHKPFKKKELCNIIEEILAGVRPSSS